MHIQSHLSDNLILINMQFNTTQSKQKRVHVFSGDLHCRVKGREVLSVRPR